MLSGISAGPSNETNQSVTITATSSNPSLIPNPTVIYSNPNATGTLVYAPAANRSGSAVITVTVRDNGGTVDGGVDLLTRRFTITVTPVNDRPTLDPIVDPPLVPQNAGLQTILLTGISPD